MWKTENQFSRGPARTLTRRLLGGLTGIGLAVATLQVAAPAVQASTSDAAGTARTTSTDWKTPVTKANTALSKALTKIADGHYAKATEQLQIVKRQTKLANTVATG